MHPLVRSTDVLYTALRSARSLLACHCNPGVRVCALGRGGHSPDPQPHVLTDAHRYRSRTTSGMWTSCPGSNGRSSSERALRLTTMCRYLLILPALLTYPRGYSGNAGVNGRSNRGLSGAALSQPLALPLLHHLPQEQGTTTHPIDPSVWPLCKAVHAQTHIQAANNANRYCLMNMIIYCLGIINKAVHPKKCVGGYCAQGMLRSLHLLSQRDLTQVRLAGPQGVYWPRVVCARAH